MHETFWHRINYFTARVMNLSLIGLPSLIACMKSIVSIFSKIGIYINPDVWDAGQSTFILPLAKLSHVKHISIPRIDWWLLLMLWLTSDERWWCFLTFYPQNSYVITISCGQFIRGVNVWWPGSLLVTVACVSNDAIIWSDDDRGEISGSRLHYLEAGARLSQGPSEVHWSRARWWPSGARGTHSGARAWRHGHWPGVTRHGRRQAPDGKLQQRIRFTSLSLCPLSKEATFLIGDLSDHTWHSALGLIKCSWSTWSAELSLVPALEPWQVNTREMRAAGAGDHSGASWDSPVTRTVWGHCRDQGSAASSASPASADDVARWCNDPGSVVDLTFRGNPGAPPHSGPQLHSSGRMSAGQQVRGIRRNKTRDRRIPFFSNQRDLRNFRPFSLF